MRHCVGRWSSKSPGTPRSGTRISAAQGGILTSRGVSGGGLEPAVAWCHEPVATRSHGLKRGDVPTWGQAVYLGAVTSSPARTESQGGPVTCFIFRSFEG